MRDATRRLYWKTSEDLKRWRDGVLGDDHCFRSVVLDQHLFQRSAPRPIEGGAAEHAAAAVAWLLQAQDASPDGGVSYGYFPASTAKGWDVSYPETTGYIMTSLVAYAQMTGRTALVERSERMAAWELEVQMPSGAVQAGKVTAAEKQGAATFNTGMVLDGYVSLLAVQDNPAVLAGAQAAADFLAGDLTEEGVFLTNGGFVTADAIKIYNVLCAWALYRFGLSTDQPLYCDTAIKAVDGALRFQKDNGWFAENCLSDSLRPLTHTIGYTLQGVLEVGLLAGRDDFVEAAELGFAPILEHIQPNGFLAGRFDSNWQPAVGWSCLTGSAQLAIVGYRLGHHLAKESYAVAADRLLNFLKAVQRIGIKSPGVNGALAGSFPIFGDYMIGGYPNWATKYLLDALMLQAKRQDTDLSLAASASDGR